VELEGLPRVEVNGSVIHFTTHIKYLGVVISNTLSWDFQVINVVKNVRTKLYQLKISRHLLPKVLKLRLIASLIFPHFDYCCAAFTNITGTLDVQLYRALNACIRFALEIGWDEHMTPFYQQLH